MPGKAKTGTYVFEDATVVGISAGEAILVQANQILEAETGTEDDLETITPVAGITESFFFFLFAQSGHTIHLINASDNIVLNSGADVDLIDGQGILMYYDASTSLARDASRDGGSGSSIATVYFEGYTWTQTVTTGGGSVPFSYDAGSVVKNVGTVPLWDSGTPEKWIASTDGIYAASMVVFINAQPGYAGGNILGAKMWSYNSGDAQIQDLGGGEVIPSDGTEVVNKFSIFLGSSEVYLNAGDYVGIVLRNDDTGDSVDFEVRFSMRLVAAGTI